MNRREAFRALLGVPVVAMPRPARDAGVLTAVQPYCPKCGCAMLFESRWDLPFDEPRMCSCPRRECGYAVQCSRFMPAR